MALVLIGLLLVAALAAVVLIRAGHGEDRDLPELLATWPDRLAHADDVALTASLDTGRRLWRIEAARLAHRFGPAAPC